MCVRAFSDTAKIWRCPAWLKVHLSDSSKNWTNGPLNKIVQISDGESHLRTTASKLIWILLSDFMLQFAKVAEVAIFWFSPQQIKSSNSRFDSNHEWWVCRKADLKVHEGLCDDECARPVEGRRDGGRGASNSARKDLPHHEPRDRAEASRETGDVGHQRHQRDPAWNRFQINLELFWTKNLSNIFIWIWLNEWILSWVPRKKFQGKNS